MALTPSLSLGTSQRHEQQGQGVEGGWWGPGHPELSEP